MQKLFSMFPRGSPGVALLLLRLSAAVMLIPGAASPLDSSTLAPFVLAIALCLGVLTPIVATLAAITEAIAMAHAEIDAALSLACLVLNALAIAMIGPGAYSCDSRIFGRRLLEFERRNKDHG